MNSIHQEWELVKADLQASFPNISQDALEVIWHCFCMGAGFAYHVITTAIEEQDQSLLDNLAAELSDLADEAERKANGSLN